MSLSELATNLHEVFTITEKDHVLNVKVLVDAFNQEKAIVWAFSVIVKTSQRFVDSSSLALSSHL